METITKEEYIRAALIARTPLTKVGWYYKAIAIPELVDEDYSKLGPLDLVKRSDGMHTLNSKKELVKIVDFTKGEPLFTINDTITIDKEVFSNVPKPIETKLGRAILQCVIFKPEIRDKFTYINEKFEPPRIEKEVGKRVRNDDDEWGKDSISMNDMKEINDNMNFFNAIADLTNIPATPRSITKADGIDEFVQKLVDEAGDTITDRVKLTEIEDKVREFDGEWLKGDPVAENLYSKKAGVGRHKLYAMYGSGLDFINDSSNDTTIITPVGGGIDPTPSELTKYINDLRYASFSRGDNTALAGVIYKDLQRSLASIRILPDPCNTTTGIVKKMTPQEIAYSVGRFIKKNGKWVAIQSIDEAKALYNKEVEMRSPQTCKAPSGTICYACLSARYKDQANGIANMAADISSTLLTMFLKLMHGTKSVNIAIDMDDLIN